VPTRPPFAAPLRALALAAGVHALTALTACRDSVVAGPDPGPPERPGGPPLVAARLRLERVAGGLQLPLHLAAPLGDRRLFVVERRGTIRVVEDGALRPEPFLDLTGVVSTAGPERGMLGLAFHPRFAETGRVYVAYTAADGAVTVARFEVRADDPYRADPASAATVIAVAHPDFQHNGGMLAFGPDGRLYVSVGDGGSTGDPDRVAQSPASLLGKLLRLDVDGAEPYAIPTDNPFVGRAGARGELWALGLRNPWRFAFDPPSGLLYVADVGEGNWEEINAVPASAPGVDYGWSTLEGAHCFHEATCDSSGTTLPILEYEHTPPCTSVTGGVVYRGTRVPAHAGRYFFADYCLGWLRSIKYGGDGRGITEYLSWQTGVSGRVQSFGVDGFGEVYLLFAEGDVYRLGAPIN
jgi:glucose/arabinose dehydrogenase